MNSVDGISDLHMSGARAVFDLDGDAAVIEKELAAAFAERGMKLESFDKLRRPRGRGLYTVDSGVT